MPLQEQTVTLPFTKGEETKLDPKLVVDGSLLALKNAHFAKQGTPQRRDAWVGLDGAELPTAPSGVVAYNDELLAVAGKTLYSYSPGEGAMVARGTVSPCTLTRTAIDREPSFADRLDMAELGNYRCYVWRDVDLDTALKSDPLGVRAVIVDTRTGTVVFGPSYVWLGFTSSPSMPDPVCPRVVGLSAQYPSNGSCFLITFTIETSGVGAGLGAAAINLATMTATPGVTIATNASLHVDAIALGGSAIIAYTPRTGGADSVLALQLRYWNGAVGIQSGPISCALASALPSADIRGLTAVAYGDSRVGVFALSKTGSTQGIWAGTIAVSPSAITAGVSMVNKDSSPAPSARSAIVGVLNGQNVTVFADASGDLEAASPGDRTAIRTISIDSSNNVTSGGADFATSWSVPHGPCGPYIWSKPFVANGAIYLPAFIGSLVNADPNLQCTWLLLDSSGEVVGRALYGTMGLWRPHDATGRNFSVTPPSVSASSGKIHIPVLERGQLAFDGGASVNVTPVGVTDLELDFSPFFSTARVGGAQFFAGAMLAQYDGQRSTEAAFHCFPEGLSTALVASGSLTGTYQYCALYEWTDAAGQRHQSAPSIAVTATPSAQNVTVTVPSLSITARTGVTVVLFRTVNNGSTFFRLNSAASALSNTPTTAHSATVNYTDSATDASIEANEILYTTSGAFENVGPGPCSAVAAHQGRLWMVGLEDGSEFRYSQAVVNGQGLQFSDALSDRIPQGSGDLSAIGVLDDKVVLHTPRPKFVVFGQGPAVDGTQNGYSTPQLLPSAHGCVDQRSLCNISSGQVYQSSRGLYLLNRGLGDEYIGSPIEGLVSGNSVVGAVVLDELQQARFVVQAPDGAIGAAVGFAGLGLGVSGFVLAYDEQFKQWSHHESDEDALFSSACVWNGEPTYAMATPTTGDPAGALGVSVGAPGLVLSGSVSSYAIIQDSAGSYKDLGTTYIPVTLTTGWIRLADLSGFERVRRLVLNGSFGSDSEITISVAVDYNETVVYSTTLDSSAAIASGQVFQLRHHLARQKVQAVQFTFTDTPLSGTGKGCDFSGLSLELGVKKGLAKLQAAAST